MVVVVVVFCVVGTWYHLIFSVARTGSAVLWSKQKMKGSVQFGFFCLESYMKLSLPFEQKCEVGV